MRQKWIDSMKKGDSTADEWLPKEPPFQIAHVWRWFLELHIGRHFGARGAEPISYMDMHAWATLTERDVSAFEIAAFRRLDARFFYVLRNPEGSAPQYLDDSAVEKQVASALRAMAARGKQQGDGKGLTTLEVKPTTKPIITVPVLSRLAKRT